MIPAKTKGVRFLVLLPVELLLTLLLLEAGLHLLRPHHTGLNALLCIPLSKSDLDDVKSLEELLNSSIVGFIPFRSERGSSFIHVLSGLRSTLTKKRRASTASCVSGTPSLTR